MITASVRDLKIVSYYYIFCLEYVTRLVKTQLISIFQTF